MPKKIRLLIGHVNLQPNHGSVASLPLFYPFFALLALNRLQVLLNIDVDVEGTTKYMRQNGVGKFFAALPCLCFDQV